MGWTRQVVLGGALVAATAGPAAAQAASSAPQISVPAPARPTDPRQRLRRNIYVMEGALVRAVDFGVKDLNRRLRSTIPEMVALSGAPQARGVYLDGYGIYFDVSVPVLNQVMMWSWGRMLGPDDSVVTAINEIKSYLQNEKDASRRAVLVDMLGRIETQVGPATSVGSLDSLATSVRQPGGAVPAQGPAVLPGPSSENGEPKFDKRAFQDPNAMNRIYTESVQNALIETMIDHAGTLVVRPEEYLTIAARDNMQRDSLAPFDSQEEVVTILLRFKGADLAAYRAGQIDGDELRKRIEIREF